MISLLAGGLVAFAAGPPPCAAWTDPKGDATTAQEGLPGTADSNLDIVAASIGTVGGSLVATITTAGLLASSSDAGDEFAVDFTVAGQEMQIYVDRTAPDGIEVELATGLTNRTSDTPLGAVTAMFDIKTKTVTLKAAAAEVTKAVGKPATGQAFSAITAVTNNQVGGLLILLPYDDAPTMLKPVFGVECSPAGPAPAAAASPSGSASPTSSASPSTSPSPSSSASPSATATATSAPTTASGSSTTCPTYTDPAGDSGPGNQPAANPVAGDNDLDLVAVTHSVAGDEFTTTFKVVKLLATGPDFSFGDRFRASFTVAGKAITVTAERDFSGFGSKKAAATVAGTAVTFPVKLLEDVKGSTIGASMSAAALEKAVGASLSGKPFSAMSTTAGAIYPSNAAPNVALNWDVATAPATASYAFGTGCGGGAATSATPTATIAVSAPSRVQTSDLQDVTVRFTTADGKPVSGATVTGRLGSGRTVSAKTSTRGTALLRVPVTVKAGTHQLVVQSGKTTVRRTTTVLAERSLLAYTISGTGDTRLVRITLTDDDRPTKHSYANAPVTFAYSGTSMTTRTDRDGQAVVRVKKGTKIDMTYAGRAGFVSSAKRQTTVE